MTSKENKIKFGLYVKEQRERMKMTQEQLAERTDLSMVTISAIERGVKAPSFESLYAIIEALGLDARRIFAYEPHVITDEDAYHYYCELGKDFTYTQLMAIIHVIEEFHKS